MSASLPTCPAVTGMPSDNAPSGADTDCTGPYLTSSLPTSTRSGVRYDLSAWIDHPSVRPRHLDAADAALKRLAERFRNGTVPILQSLGDATAAQACRDICQSFARNAQLVVHFGVGGSLHAGKVFATAAANEARTGVGKPQLQFMGSIDPDAWSALLDTLHRTGPEHVCAVFSSKSGRTTETLSQCALMLDWYQHALGPAKIRHHAVCVTEPGPSPLRALAEAHGVPVLGVPAEVGGRFAAFTASGLLPAMMAGHDPDHPTTGVRVVAQAVLDEALQAGGRGPAARSAAALAAFLERFGTGTVTTLGYGARLGPLQAWYRQLAAESLGKAGQGFTPVSATGTDDEHSQLQLWLDGPPSQLFTLIRTQPANDVRLEAGGAESPGLLPDQLGPLWSAHADATYASLVARDRPVRVFEIPSRDPGACAALMMQFMLETLLLADILGIDPYGQPAVDDTKERIFNMLGQTTH